MNASGNVICWTWGEDDDDKILSKYGSLPLFQTQKGLPFLPTTRQTGCNNYGDTLEINASPAVQNRTRHAASLYSQSIPFHTKKQNKNSFVMACYCNLNTADTKGAKKNL